MSRVRVITSGRTAATTLAFGLFAVTWGLGSVAEVGGEDAAGAGKPTVSGRVIDEGGRPIAGARVRLYRRNSRWERTNAVVGTATTEPGGEFALETPLKRLAPTEARGQAPYVVVADAPGKAVGWKTIPHDADTFRGDVILSAPMTRTITVLDADRRPLEGAKVAAHGVGDASSPVAEFRDHLALRPEDGPLTAITGADGRATLTQLPKTQASFVAKKTGFSEDFAFREQDTIRLTPGATLTGTVTGPDGAPLAGIRVVLFTGFMWDFSHTVTDARGRYRFEDQKAQGWDMSAWTPGSTANGKYKLWIDSDRYAVSTESLILHPGTTTNLDLKAVTAGVIRVTVVEEGSNKRVPNTRIWGFDAETATSARFNAYTDEHGQARFYSVPSKVSLSLVGPPEGVHIKGDLRNATGSHQSIEFTGGEADVILVMPPIMGTLITVSGTCTLPGGKAAGGAAVIAGAGNLARPAETSLDRTRHTDGMGRFSLEGLPSGHRLQLYGETSDRKFAGTTAIDTPDRDDPKFRVNLDLGPTVVVERTIKNEAGKPLNSKRFQVTPKLGENEFFMLRRDVTADAEGRIKLDGIVPGLSYRVVEVVERREAVIFVQNGRQPWFDQVIVLAPRDQK